MSSEDQVRPYHAKDEARGQQAAEAVAAVLKHAAEKERVAHAKQPRKKQPKWMLPLGINLAVLAVYLLIAPPAFVTVNPIDPPDMARQTQGAATALWMFSQQIESYRISNGRLPASLDELGRPAEGIDYLPQGDQYQLITTVGDTPLVWDSQGANTEIIAAAGRATQGIS